jgi:hypothetical protein
VNGVELQSMPNFLFLKLLRSRACEINHETAKPFAVGVDIYGKETETRVALPLPSDAKHRIDGTQLMEGIGIADSAKAYKFTDA